MSFWKGLGKAIGGIGKAIGKGVSGIFSAPAEAVGAVVGGVTNLIGNNQTNKYNAHIADRTNQLNYQMSQENMAWQEQMMDKQNQWNLEQWNRENEYNSPAAQYQRFMDAGINPALAMTGGANAGTASSMQSAQPAASPGLPNMVTPQRTWDASIGNNIGNLFATLGAQANQNALTGSQLLNDQFERDNKALIGKGLKIDNRQRKLDFRLAKASYSYQLESLNQQNELQQLAIYSGRNRLFTESTLNKYLDQQQVLGIEASILQNVTQAYQLYKNKLMTPIEYAQALEGIRLTTAQAIKTDYEAKGIKLQNDHFNKISKYLVKSAEYQSLIDRNSINSIYWDNKLRKQNYEINIPSVNRARFYNNDRKGNGHWGYDISDNISYAIGGIPTPSFRIK